MAMIRMKEGAWLDWHGVRWRLERRQDDTTEWRATDGSLRHASFRDQEIAEGVSNDTMGFFDGHGRPPATPTNDTGDRGAPRPTADDLEEARRRLQYVLEAHESGLMDPSKSPDDWQKAVDRVWDDQARHWTRLRRGRRGEPVDKPCVRSVRRWVADAGDPPRQDRLVPRHRHKGNFDERIADAVHDIIERAIDDDWMARPPIPLEDLKTIVQTKVRELNATLPPGAKAYALPGDGSLLSCISARPRGEVHRARHGEMSWFLKFGSAEAQEDPEAPLDVVELDSTPADLFVLCSKSGLPLGRPTIVICIDRCTRMVLGWFVTFEKPSILSLMQTLRNAILPKTYVADMNERAGWGIRHACVTWGVPRVLRYDRALENLAPHIKELAARIGINRIHRLARKSPWLKGCVESSIGTMSERLLHPTKGTSFCNTLEKMGYDSAKDAVCTTADLDWALHKYFIDVYPREPRRGLDGRRAIDAWTKLTKIHPVTIVGRQEDVDHLFGRTDQAVPGRHGIRALSMSYFSRELLDLFDDTRFVAALKKAGGSLNYHLDPADIGQIVVELPHEDRHIVVPVAPKWRRYATGLSLFAHRRIRDYTAKQTRDANDADDLLACKHELLQILRGSMGPRGSIADRQLLQRIEGTTTMARAGDDASTSPDQSPLSAGPLTTLPPPSGPAIQPKAAFNDDGPVRGHAVDASGEPDGAASSLREFDPIPTHAPRLKKGYRP